MAQNTHPWDSLSEEELADKGSMKWTRFPGTLPGFVAEMDFPLAPAIADALHRAVDTPLLGYLPEPTKAQMREATAEFLLDEYGWSVPDSRILPTADVLSAYEVTLRTLLPAGAPVIIPTPAYMPFLTLTPMLGHPVIEIPMVAAPDGRPQMNLERIDQELQGGAGMVVLCNPHNPLGLVYSQDELLALAEVVDRRGGLVFSDEIHAPLTFFGHRHLPYASLSDTTAQHTVTSTSASKAWNLPGLKCAQLIVSSDAHREKFTDVEFLVSHGAATPGVIANTAAYRDSRDWLAEAKSYIERSATVFGDLVSTLLPGSGFRQLEGTYIAWLDARSVDIGSYPSPAHYFGGEAKVSVTDGALCGQAGVGHIRIILATPLPILEKMVHRLAEHWN